MSLKSFIAQVEAQQLNEFAPTAPSTTSTATAPQQGQKVIVKPGQPQQSTAPQATITNQAGKVIAQADADDAKKLGDLVNTGDITLMDPMTGKPLEESAWEDRGQLEGALAKYTDVQWTRDTGIMGIDTAFEYNPIGSHDSGISIGVNDTNYFVIEPFTQRDHYFRTLPEALKFAKPIIAKLSSSDKIAETNELNEGVSTIDEALQTILARHPHEHKMCQEGWGMHESLYEALRDHYFEQGRIPRELMHGEREALRKYVEECYAQDTMGGNEDAINNGTLEQESIEDRIGDNLQPETNPEKQNSLNTPAYMRKQAEQGGKPTGAPVQEEVSELEKRLKQPTEESTMFESKKTKAVAEATEKTKTGVKHTADAGGYGRKHGSEDVKDQYGTKIGKVNLDKEDKKAEKKGRGRPKKDQSPSGSEISKDAFSAFGGGKLPKKEIGKLSHKHRIKTKADSDKVDESISKWDAQLKTLLEGKQVVKEGLSVSTSVGQEGAPDSVSITASDEDAHQLLALLNNAGMGSGVPGHAVKSNPVEELLKAHGSSDAGGSFSTAGTEEPSDVEVTDFDGAQDEISGGEDDGMDAMKKMLAAMGIGSEAAPEPKHPDIAAGSDSEEETDSEEDGEDSEEKEEIVGEEWSDEKADEDYDDDGEVESEKDEHEGAVGNAIEKSEGEDDAEDDDEDKEKVKEGAETQCNECGAMYEGDDHTCSHVEESQLNEWANSPQGQSEDEEFTATIEYFTKAISGGLNGQKKDQTVMPHTSVKVSEGYTINVADEMRKLAGIK